ncbi:SRPBCC domain-containing protein [Amycolatopsis acidicola]|uniref:SRPBCC domain-containing protein n=1 Tax=Amycolatopsis acidicola TaxID=2596893 RepID=A0A5N0UJG9_9PSEU|nr:SRPBCC domain-containing protein [Amycolatopsis acidicola]KAA9148524.1 SRPBCC domain-containing protein [Amycolatopsis acidicola]
MTSTHVLERTYSVDPATIWRFWTTVDGIACWWAPDGFTTTVDSLDLREGGELVYTMTATAPETVEFMKSAGMPLETVSRKRFTRLDEPKTLAYASLVDFVPDHEPYEFGTEVELVETDGGTRVVMTVESLHDETWTQRLLDGRANELANLARILEA